MKNTLSTLAAASIIAFTPAHAGPGILSGGPNPPRSESMETPVAPAVQPPLCRDLTIEERRNGLRYRVERMVNTGVATTQTQVSATCPAGTIPIGYQGN